MIDETLPEFDARHGGPGSFAAYVASDLAAFNEWREWSPMTLAAYVTCLKSSYEREKRG